MKHVIRKLASTISQPRIQATNYIPGVCNIGPAERARRKQWGIICVVTYILVLTVLIVLHAPRMYRLALIVPAFGALLGFLQGTARVPAGSSAGAGGAVAREVRRTVFHSDRLR